MVVASRPDAGSEESVVRAGFRYWSGCEVGFRVAAVCRCWGRVGKRAKVSEVGVVTLARCFQLWLVVGRSTLSKLSVDEAELRQLELSHVSPGTDAFQGLVTIPFM